jgi:hypothetical protein
MALEANKQDTSRKVSHQGHQSQGSHRSQYHKAPSDSHRDWMFLQKLSARTAEAQQSKGLLRFTNSYVYGAIRGAYTSVSGRTWDDL